MKTELLREQVRLVFKQLLTMQGSSLVVALVLSYVVRNDVPNKIILFWLFMVLLVVAGRITLYYSFLKVSDTEFPGEYWRNWYLALAGISGLVWGSSAFLLLPVSDPMLISLFVLVIAALSAAIIISHSSIRWAPAFWSVPALLSYALRLSVSGGEEAFAISFLIVLYLLTILNYSGKHYKTILSFICVKFENLRLLNEVKQTNEILGLDITERRKAEEALRLNERRLETLLKINMMKFGSEKELTDFALEEAVRLSASEGGYLHFFNEDKRTIQLYSWSRDVLKTCATAKSEHYPLDKAGIWADSVRLRKVVIHNDYRNMAEKRGCPEGHFQLVRHMGVPIFDGESIVGVVGVSNKEEPYDDTDAIQTNLFVNSMWRILKQRRTEETVRKLSRSVEQSPVSVVITDTNGTIEYVNPKFSEITGYTFQEAIGKNPRVLKSGQTRREVYEQLWDTILSGKEWHGVFCNRKKKGDIYWESATIAPVSDEAGRITHYVAVKQDITDRLIAEDLLKKSEKKLRDITSSLGEGVFVFDSYGKVIFMNPEAESLLGWTQEELSDKNIHDVIHHCKAGGVPLSWGDCPLSKVFVSGERYASNDEIFCRKDGSEIPVSVISTPVVEDNKVTAVVTAFRDITEIKEAQEALDKANQLLELQATTDSLTGIFNRLKFDDMLIKEMSRAKRFKIPLSLVMFDIDHFKKINDTFGHHMGDTVLKELTFQISKRIRKHDYFARWGGEEFMILLSHNTLEPAAQFAESCRAQTENLKIGSLEGIPCSFGVTELQADDDIFSFTKRADDALYLAKTGGRNRVVKL